MRRIWFSNFKIWNQIFLEYDSNHFLPVWFLYSCKYIVTSSLLHTYATHNHYNNVRVLHSVRKSRYRCSWSLSELTRDYKPLLDERNRHNLELLERCLCVVCIDDDVLPTTFNNPLKKEDRWIGDRDYANVLHHALHGGGSRHLGANRWFDKTFHAILGKV